MTRVLIDGDVVAEDGKMTVPFKPYSYPAWAMDSVHVGGSITQMCIRDSTCSAAARVPWDWRAEHG